MRTRLWLTLLIIILAVPACAGKSTLTPVLGDPITPEPVTLILMTHDSFSISEEVLAEFEENNNAEIILLPAGDTGAALNQAILAKDDPLADLFFGVDNAFLSRAIDADIFIPYQSPVLANIPADLVQDERYRLLPVDYGDVCLNYDRAWFSERDMPLPVTLDDLADPLYKGLLVVENPATSSPGLAFLLATIDVFGTETVYGFREYWRDLRKNDVLVTDGWEEAYFGHFSAAGAGERPLVVSYASSPPAEILFADPPVDKPPSASITAPSTCFRQIEFVGIIKGTDHLELAQALVDFMLSKTFQEDIPLNMFVFPANQEATLPEIFIRWAQIPDQPTSISPELIEANREDWINAWTDVVLR